MPRRVTGVQHKNEGFVIREHMKSSVFLEMTEVFYCNVHSQQFSVEGALACLYRCHPPGEEQDGMPGTTDVLL